MNKPTHKLMDAELADRANSLINAGDFLGGMNILYEMLTEDIELTVAPDGFDFDKKMMVLETAIAYYSTPVLEQYEKCAILLNIKNRIVNESIKP